MTEAELPSRRTALLLRSPLVIYWQTYSGLIWPITNRSKFHHSLRLGFRNIIPATPPDSRTSRTHSLSSHSSIRIPPLRLQSLTHWSQRRCTGLFPQELVVELQDDSTKQEGAFCLLDLFPLFYSERRPYYVRGGVFRVCDPLSSLADLQ